jgi:hypothetical protein
MSKLVTKRTPALQWSRFSRLSEGDRKKNLEACFELTNAIYEGLNLEGEVRVVDTQKLGDTVLLWGETGLAGFAVCHWGAGTEAGSEVCYVKFGAIRPSPAAGENLEWLLDTCEALAAVRGLQTLMTGANMGCHEAYRVMRKRGFRDLEQDVAMHRPNEPAYNRPGIYAIGAWG